MFADSTLRRPPLPFPAQAVRAASPSALRADFETHGGRRRWAIGGGRTVDDVREAPPLGPPWQLIGLRALYGQ